MTDDLISRAALLPCPFCGADAKLLGGPLAQETYSIWCSGRPSHHQDCGFDAEKAITAWNTRAIPADRKAVRRDMAERIALMLELGVSLPVTTKGKVDAILALIEKEGGNG